MDIAWRILATLGLVALNGYFVAAEFAAVGARPSRVEELAKAGFSGRLALKVKNRLDLYLSTCQLGITLASLGLGAVTEPAVAAMITPALELVGVSPQNIHGLSLAIGLLIATALHVVVGEVAPKNLAIFYPDRILPVLAPPLVAFTALLYPAIWLLNAASNLLLRLVGVPIGKDAHGGVAMSPEELRTLLRQASLGGTIEPAQTTLLTSAFEFAELRVRQIMTPRTRVEYLRVDQGVKEVLRVAQNAGYSRLPVCEKDLDHVVGVVHLKDLLSALRLVPGKLRVVDPRSPEGHVIAIPEGKPGSALHVIGSGHLDLRKIKHDVLFVPETMPVPRLLREFQASQVHLAVVVDEYGATQGVVTLEDVLEEIVGEIDDEFDAARSDFVEQDGTWTASGLLPLHELRSKLGLDDLPAGGVDTIGGYVTQRLGRFPRVGDTVPLGKRYEAHVRGVHRRSITQVQIVPTPPAEAADSPTSL